MFYLFRRSNNYTRRVAGPPPTPNMVFEPSHTLPVMTIYGPGSPVLHQGFRAGSAIAPIQTRQIDYRQAWLLAGVGGLSAGMMYGYPLSANSLGQPIE